MAIRTSEQLKAMFQQSKEQKEQQRQQQRLEKQQQYQQLCKEADRLLKEDQERLKREKMEQLSTFTKKTPQKPLKCTVTELYISGNRYIEKDANWMHLYKTREELMQAEERGEGKINWDVLDKLIKMTKEELGLI